MSKLETISTPNVGWLTAKLAPGEVTLEGTIAIENPNVALGGFLRQIHQAAVEDRLTELSVNVKKLTFVNSSAIRLLVDWSTWVRNEPEPQRYRLKFVTDPQVTWQKISFRVLKNLAPGAVVTDP
jgi:hypothetical protein